MLPYSASQKYPGRKLTFQAPSQEEVQSRIALAWWKFFLLKRELTTKSHSLKRELRLFHGTVTPTILYGCTSWTLTQELENRLRWTQRQMMRMILGSTRRRATQQNETPSNNSTTPAPTNNTPAPTNEYNHNSDTDTHADNVDSK